MSLVDPTSSFHKTTNSFALNRHKPQMQIKKKKKKEKKKPQVKKKMLKRNFNLKNMNP